MDFDLPEELKMLKDTVRRFVDKELIPVEKDTCILEEMKPHYQEHFEKRAKELGIWQYDVPVEYGGSGMPILARVVLWEEFSRSVGLPARGDGITGPSPRRALYMLDGEMKEKYLLPVLRGEKKTCFAQTEPDAGSDPGAMRTSAVKDGNGYVVNGVKRFITGAGKADFIQLLAATDKGKGSRGGISMFLVDMDTPGVKLTTQYETMMGDRPWEIVLENVRVPASNLVGDEGEGMAFGQEWINIGRVKHGAHSCGVAERCLELATTYAKQRSTFGQPLAHRQGVQWMLADMYVELQAARMLVYKTAWRMDRGEEAREDAYVCKFYADEMAFRAADKCMQIHGGIGLTTDLPIEKMWRQQRSFRITEGATEVMKMVIARHVLKTYA